MELGDADEDETPHWRLANIHEEPFRSHDMTAPCNRKQCVTLCAGCHERRHAEKLKIEVTAPWPFGPGTDGSIYFRGIDGAGQPVDKLSFPAILDYKGSSDEHPFE